jgi:regulator of protease activity HflC (stomatin/prohibitin superfamily)
MDTAFSWIGQIAEWLGRWIPQILIVRATHAGVKFVRGKRVKEMRPGMHIYWPLTTEVSILPTARQTHNLVTQVMMTKDKHQVVVGGVVIYTITNIVDALSENWDVSDTIGDITQTALVAVITSWSLEDLISKITTDLERELTVATRERLRPYGVKVHKCALTDFSTCKVLKLLSDGSSTITTPLALERR